MHNTAVKAISAPMTATSGSGGALYLVLTQVVSRAFTFLGNQFLLLYLSPSLLGLAVQLELLSVTILYFARESLRVALQRQPSGESRRETNQASSQQVINLAFLAISVGLCVAGGFGSGYLRHSSDEVLGSDDFWLAFRLYAIATAIELLAEPSFVIIQQHALYGARARAETTAALSRCAAACATAMVMHARRSRASVLPFAVGQLFYAVALFVAYLAAVVPVRKAEGFSLLPRRIGDETNREQPSKVLLGLFSKPVLSLTVTFYAQSIFKLLLTQGDSLILSFLTDLKSQGAFALASNYGGLLSRLIFQPVEESSRNVFGRLLAPADGIESESKRTSTSTSNSQRDKQSQSPNTNIPHISNTSTPPSPLQRALSHLSTTLHIYTLFTLPLLTLLPPLLPPLTNLALRPQWRTPETTSLLQAYLYYIPFLALNGVLDAFVTSVATPAELRTQSLLMAGITGAYGLVAWALMGTSASASNVRGLLGMGHAWGSSGLVYANMVNMAFRIAFSVWFVGRWVARREGGGRAANEVVRRLWMKSLPSLSCVVVAAAVGGGLRGVLGRGVGNSAQMPEKRFLGIADVSLEDVGYTLGATVVLGTSIIVSEHQFLLGLVLPLLPERLASKIRTYLPVSKTK